MPRQKIADQWREVVFGLLGEDTKRTDAQIFAIVGDMAAAQGRDDFPSVRSIGRMKGAFKRMSAEEQANYRLARWPESFIQGLLPWEASASFMELMAYVRGQKPVRLVRWYYRVSLAAPNAPAEAKFQAASKVAAQEAAGVNPAAGLRSAELYLLRAPWRSDQAHEEYQRAAVELGIEELGGRSVTLGQVGQVTVDQIEQVVANMTGQWLPEFRPIAEGIVEILKHRERREQDGQASE